MANFRLILIWHLFCFAFVIGEVIGPFTSTAPLPVAPKCRFPSIIQRNPSTAFGNGVYLVVWSDGSRQPVRKSSDIYCARISAITGAVLDSQGILICDADYRQNNPRVAFDGTNFLVVWDDFRNDNDYDVYGARVSEFGRVLDAGGFIISARAGVNEVKPDVVFTGSNYLVVWMDARRPLVYGIFGARVNAAGIVQDNSDGIELICESQGLIDSLSPPNFEWTGVSKYNAYLQWFENLSSKSQPALAWNGKKCVLSFVSANKVGRPTNDLGLLFVDVISGASTGGVNVWKNSSPDNFQDRPAPVASESGVFIFAGLQSSSRGGGPSCMAFGLYDTLNVKARSYVSPQVMNAQRESRKAAVYTGTHFITAMDYWINASDELTSSAIALNRYKAEDTTFLDKPLPGTLIESISASQGRVRHCAMASGLAGEFILLYEKDEGVNQCKIVSRLMKEN